MNKVFIQLAALVIIAAIIVGCGSNSNKNKSSSQSRNAVSAATGDIPDNQVFLTYKSDQPAFSIKYPEGWSQSVNKETTTFRNNNNLATITVKAGAAISVASVQKEMDNLKSTTPSISFKTPQAITLGAKQMVKVVYTTTSAANATTGKTVKLMVDRYEVSKAGKVAIVELSTPEGVDNVDAYRLMIESFKW